LDKVSYTGESPKDDLIEELNVLLSRFIRETSTIEEKGVDCELSTLFNFLV